MSSYFIFALVLTVLYIVYYAVNITRDLYGKKGTEKTDEEVFDLGPMDATVELLPSTKKSTGASPDSVRQLFASPSAESILPPARHHRN